VRVNPVDPPGPCGVWGAASWNWSQWCWRAVGRLISSTLQPAAFRGLGWAPQAGPMAQRHRDQMMAGNDQRLDGGPTGEWSNSHRPSASLLGSRPAASSSSPSRCRIYGVSMSGSGHWGAIEATE
jgi:hypothetical protein